jgi:hypothetical protein
MKTYFSKSRIYFTFIKNIKNSKTVLLIWCSNVPIKKKTLIINSPIKKLGNGLKLLLKNIFLLKKDLKSHNLLLNILFPKKSYNSEYRWKKLIFFFFSLLVIKKFFFIFPSKKTNLYYYIKDSHILNYLFLNS